MKGGDLVTFIEHQTHSPFSTRKEISIEMLHNAIHPIYQMIKKWLLEGKIDDVYGEFFLKSSEHPKLLQNSEIINENIPSFFEDIVEDVKFVGEAILFLQSEGEDVKETIDLIKKNWLIFVENSSEKSSQKCYEMKDNSENEKNFNYMNNCNMNNNTNNCQMNFNCMNNCNNNNINVNELLLNYNTMCMNYNTLLMRCNSSISNQQMNVVTMNYPNNFNNFNNMNNFNNFNNQNNQNNYNYNNQNQQKMKVNTKETEKNRLTQQSEFFKFLHSISHSIHERCVRLVTQKYHPLQHLQIIKEFVLLFRGDFAWNLIDNLTQKIKLDGSITKVDLFSCFSSALQLVQFSSDQLNQSDRNYQNGSICRNNEICQNEHNNENNENCNNCQNCQNCNNYQNGQNCRNNENVLFECLHRLKITTEQKTNTIKNIEDEIILSYEFPQALQLLIPKTHLKQYEEIFKFLWRTKCLLHRLDSIQKSFFSFLLIISNVKKLPLKVMTWQSQLREALKFVSTIEEYCYHYMEECSRRFDDAWKNAIDLDLLSSIHQKYLDEIRTVLYMKKSSQNSYQGLAQGFAQSSFHSSFQSSSQSFSPTFSQNPSQGLRSSAERRSLVGQSTIENPISAIIHNLYFFIGQAIEAMEAFIREISNDLNEFHGIFGDMETKKRFNQKIEEFEDGVNVQLGSYEQIFGEFMTEISSSDSAHARFLLRRLNPNYKRPLDCSVIFPMEGF